VDLALCVDEPARSEVVWRIPEIWIHVHAIVTRKMRLESLPKKGADGARTYLLMSGTT
jgi:hypothetical protein